MIGLIVLGFTLFMIYTLVKNALTSDQLSNKDHFTGKIDLIIPLVSRNSFFPDYWAQNLSGISSTDAEITIHLLAYDSPPSSSSVEAHAEAESQWKEITQKLPEFKIHHLTNRPLGRETVSWMIESIQKKLTGDIIIVGDPELVGLPQAFISAGKLVSEKKIPLLVLSQTSKSSPIGEALFSIGPTLALVSFYSFRKMRLRRRKIFSPPLLGPSLGWIAMPGEIFHSVDWSKLNIHYWKEALTRTWDLSNQGWGITFGEKHLIHHYPEDLKSQLNILKNKWDEIFTHTDRTGVIIYLMALFIWSFPVYHFIRHPFWALTSLFLLFLYRFFTKIIFQESWSAPLLHPLSVLAWIGTLAQWGVERFLEKKRFKIKE